MAVIPTKCSGGNDRGAEIIGLNWGFTALGLVAVLVKIYARVKLIKAFGWDDVIVFVSMICVVAGASLQTAGVHYGLGRHHAALTPSAYSTAIELSFIANAFIILAFSLPNVAVAIFIERILPPRKTRTAVLYTLTAFQSLTAVANIILLFTACLPPASLWNFTVKPSSCRPPSVAFGFSYFTGAFAALTGFVLALVPAWSFRNLQVSTRTKVGISLTMGMTGVSAVVAVLKTTQLGELGVVGDYTHATSPLDITGLVESNVLVVAACIPSLKPFVRHMVEVGRKRSSAATRDVEGTAGKGLGRETAGEKEKSVVADKDADLADVAGGAGSGRVSRGAESESSVAEPSGVEDVAAGDGVVKSTAVSTRREDIDAGGPSDPAESKVEGGGRW